MSKNVTLYIVRHAKAADRGPKYPDDSVRPLVKAGRRQALDLARLLEKMDVSLGRVGSSPYTRALETAEPLKTRLPKGQGIETLEPLANGDHDRLLTLLNETYEDTMSAALVGHKPFVGELASYLLTGNSGVMDIAFKKAMVMVLAGGLEPGRMRLTMALPPKLYRPFVS
ncbi:MAG: phosphohistidine phosphatase SixA [Trueperaceae bacterium]|nr:phosphohistidine phosphatase SixA [Trueperaceae bacterium]